jgi:hypothetical protein
MYEKSRKYTKWIAVAIVGSSTYFVTNAVLRQNTPDPEKKLEKVKLNIGCFTISTLVADVAKDWTDAKVDRFFDMFDLTIEPIDAIESDTTE